MSKKITKYVIIGIAILLAELLSAFFFLVMQKYKSAEMPYRSTAIQMLASLVVYYPLITFLDKYFKSGSKNLLASTKKIANHHIGGVILAFAIAFFLIWVALVRVWYNKSFFGDIGHWIERSI